MMFKQMVVAIIDEEDMLELGGQCQQVAKDYAIGINSVVKKVKLAAGLLSFIA